MDGINVTDRGKKCNRCGEKQATAMKLGSFFVQILVWKVCYFQAELFLGVSKVTEENASRFQNPFSRF